MWSRAGPQRSSETGVGRLELLPWRPLPTSEDAPAEYAARVPPAWNSVESTPLYFGSPCVLSSYIFSWYPPFNFSLLRHQPPVQMPLEPRNAPRAYQRIYRRYNIQHPYRLLSLSERMHRYTPILPSLQEEESAEQRSNIEVRERPRLVAKRTGRNHSTNNQGLIYPNALPRDNEELQIISSDERARYPNRFTQWQADEPQIIITSDVQLQTDESVYEITEQPRGLTVYSSVGPTTLSSSRSQAGFGGDLRTCSPSAPQNNNNLVREPVLRAMPGYQNTHNSYSTNDVTDRGTQISPEPHDNSEIIYLDSEHQEVMDLDSNNTEVVNVESENSEIIDLVSENSETMDLVPYSEKTQNEANEASLISYKLYSRSASMPSLPVPTLASRQVANRVIKHARNNKTLNEKALHCPNCDLFPILPVTGQCGHTRCAKCIRNNGSCPCGAEAPKSLHVNTVVQYLIGKMLPTDSSRRDYVNNDRRTALSDEAVIAASRLKTDTTVNTKCGRLRRSQPPGAPSPLSVRIRAALPNINERMPMSPQMQFEHANRLLSLGRYRDAAPHFARVGASSKPLARTARLILAQIIVVLAEGRDPRRIARELLRAVRLQSAASWLRPTDLECVLCYHTYIKPVTTPCGHTYCRTCIERALDYRKACALCLRPLDDFDLTTARETTFLSAALESIDASKPPLPLDPDVIPIFVCTVAYPSIPCPLFIFDPRYWLMIRRVLESGSRKFGMVAYERDKNYSDYGTVLEVCDCVHLEDGRSFLSTVGVSRFRVIERDVRDGCDVARIQPLTDITPTEEMVILEMKLMGSQILCKALLWFNSMNKTVRQEIETAFGQIPRGDHVQEDWWESPDGPAWLWWLIAILPLRSEIKVLILSTKNLLKRMMAVSRTLDAIDQVAITTTATSECEIRSALTNAEEWLERGS